MSTIKLNELAESDINLSDLIAKSDTNGLMTRTNIEKLANYIGDISTSGMKAAIESTSPAPTEDGLYPCTESGTYTNFGGEVVDITNQLVFISVSDTQTVFTLVEIPLNITFDSVPTLGSTNAVESGGVYNSLSDLQKNINSIENNGVSIVLADLPNGDLPDELNGNTWSILNGKAINTPSETSFAINDGGLEDWVDANNLTYWSKNIPSGGNLNRVTDSKSGTYAAKITVNSSGTRTEISQNVLVPIGNYYNVQSFAKSNIDQRVLRINNDNQLASTSITPLSNVVYTKMINSSFRKTASGQLMIQNYGNANTEYTIDDVSVNLVDKNTILSTSGYIGNLSRVKAYTKPYLGSFSGVVINIDDISNPLNYIALVKQGGDDNQVLLWKMVNGIMSQVTSVIVDEYDVEFLLELRQISLDNYDVYVNGRKQGATIVITEPTINTNGINGMLSSYIDNEFEYFSSKKGADTVSVPNGSDLKDYYKYLSSGDTLELAENGTYNLAASDRGFDVIPNGMDGARTIVKGNGSEIIGGISSYSLSNKEYLEFFNLKLTNSTSVLGAITGNSKFITMNNIIGTSTELTIIDFFKNQQGPTDLEFNDCIAYMTIDTGVVTVDGFEDWGVSRVTYNRCVAYGFKNGISSYNNGHGFESYSGNSATDEHCEDITYNNCIAYDCRVGFSSEGGIPEISGVNIIAKDCIAYNNEIADVGGVNNSEISVTIGTLLNRQGLVNDIAYTTENSDFIRFLLLGDKIIDNNGNTGNDGDYLKRSGNKILWLP